MSDDFIDQELIDSFKEESNQLLDELLEVVEKLEDVEVDDDFPTALLQEFAQKIDRIMGAAQTIAMGVPDHPGFNGISRLAELCKKLGYKAADLKQGKFIPLFAGFWADTLDIMEEFLENLEDTKTCEQIQKKLSQALVKRLEWLGGKLRQEEGAASSESSKNMAQSLVDDLLEELS